MKFVRSGDMVMSQNGLPISIRNDYIDLLSVETEMSIIRNSTFIQEWDWNTSIKYIQNNDRNDIDTVDLYFQQKK